ncbi:hypothetical protein P7K49_003253 [Saguinus oedipus]|uniref:Uncharacterized protein n=1 Tax=Saguinus oedipus TaxID=9490 RepID=A0ABQ9WNR0_SAGOE|nr:hypothetical protein P7K49_003253 [Saguinus oedipus]
MDVSTALPSPFRVPLSWMDVSTALPSPFRVPLSWMDVSTALPSPFRVPLSWMDVSTALPSPFRIPLSWVEHLSRAGPSITTARLVLQSPGQGKPQLDLKLFLQRKGSVGSRVKGRRLTSHLHRGEGPGSLWPHVDWQMLFADGDHPCPAPPALQGWVFVDGSYSSERTVVKAPPERDLWSD